MDIVSNFAIIRMEKAEIQPYAVYLVYTHNSVCTFLSGNKIK